MYVVRLYVRVVRFDCAVVDIGSGRLPSFDYYRYHIVIFYYKPLTAKSDLNFYSWIDNLWSTLDHSSSITTNLMNNADTITNCANCGKGEESTGDLKSCAACKSVKYCNRECQLHIVPYTKRHARNVLQNYMMKLYSKIIHLGKIVQYAFNHCHWMKAKRLSNHAVGK